MTLNETLVPQRGAPSLRKIAWIAGIAIATLIPTFLVSQLAGEREDRATNVNSEIAAAWGPDQMLKGPTLVLPITAKDGAMRFLTLAPQALDVKAEVAPTLRRRGLFATTVYVATIAMSGRFELPDGFREGGPENLKTGTAFVAIDVAGAQGVRDGDRLEIGEDKSDWQSCSDVIPGGNACAQGSFMLLAEADLAKASGTSVPFRLTLHVRGTGSLRFVIAAKYATTRIAGSWPTPSFIGSDLPVTTTSSQGGFEANWTIDKVGKPPYLQANTLSSGVGGGSTVGVGMIEGEPLYRTVTRISKYGLLIVILAFAAYFLFETATGAHVALFQYGMLGASLSLFILLLLSFSEMIGYEAAYALCAALVTAQASLYTLSVTRSLRASAGFAAILATVFCFFYVLVRLESYALVVGSFALFIVLTIVMAVTEIVGVGQSLPLGPTHDAELGNGR
jgi:inner membrane protein